MPYRRKYRKKPYAKKPWYNRSYTPYQLAQKAWKGVKYIKSLVNVEKKHHDVLVDSAISATGSITNLVQIAQGDTDQTRSGNSILGQTEYIQFAVNQHASATNTFFRLMVVRDNQQISDTAPAIGDILDSTFSSQYVVAPLNNEFGIGRFSVLCDKRFALSANGSTSRIDKIFIPVRKHVRYNGSATSDIQKGGLYLLLVSNEATNTPTFEAVCRFAFTDN